MSTSNRHYSHGLVHFFVLLHLGNANVLGTQRWRPSILPRAKGRTQTVRTRLTFNFRTVSAHFFKYGEEIMFCFLKFCICIPRLMVEKVLRSVLTWTTNYLWDPISPFMYLITAERFSKKKCNKSNVEKKNLWRDFLFHRWICILSLHFTRIRVHGFYILATESFFKKWCVILL